MTTEPAAGTVEPAKPQRELRLLSVVAPALDEAETVVEFHRRMVEALEGIDFELIVVDDGSTDETPEVLRRTAATDPRLKVITLSRNFGHQAAITAGLDHAKGDAVAIIDSDLQDPPEVIPKLLARWREGVDVVYAVRTVRPGESRAKLATSRWFYRLFGRLAHIDLEQNAGDFRLFDRGALDALNSMRERNRFLRGMSVWIGFTQTAVPYERDPRYAGVTKYTPRRMVRFSLDAISSFSHVPLQLATGLGFLVSMAAFLGIPIAIARKLTGHSVPGVTTILLAVLLIGGIQLITVGLIGEYLGRVYDEVKHRPLYVVKDRLNTPARRPGPDDGPPG
ncbi:MAG: polyisoprenyl-phosphate glycosyltransferase [Solirubrobacterales bacterium]|nr:polyisoprenyl-phosphate glycosyltransferase [Solirubrobacterales bacterium]